MRALPLLLLATFPARAAPLPASLEEFLGPTPARFDQRFARPARDLKAADALIRDHKLEAAAKKLTPLANGEMGEHALFALANVYREKKDFLKSLAQGEKLLRSYPGTVYFDRVKELLDADECDQALVAKGDEGEHLLERCLWRTPWKGWGELEPQATALYNRLRLNKDLLLDPFVAELIQAMPANTALRQRLVREISADKLDHLASLARFHTKATSGSGPKFSAVDTDKFDEAMKLVLKQDWKGANALFQAFVASFPQSEHVDRAQYWIARTHAKLGHDEEAKKRFTQILEDSPLTYYGLQAALYLKRDWNSKLADSPAPLTARWQGSLTTRQALSLWRLRALLAQGLLDYAREEAKSLAAARFGSAGIGQEDPKGELFLARLFETSGNYMAAFSQAYAALSLDPALLNRDSLALIFPRPFADAFQRSADRTGVNPLLLVSVAKQESAFLPNAISHSDALGLMQLLPVTAKEVLPSASRADLFEPGPNTQAGGIYLAGLLSKYQGNIALSLAAYNAGPHRVVQWMGALADTPLFKEGFDPDAFIDTIPFTETRKYVGSILRNYAWYKLLSEGGPVPPIQELVFQWQKTQKKTADAPSPAPLPEVSGMAVPLLNPLPESPPPAPPTAPATNATP